MMPVGQLRVTVGEHDLKGPELPAAVTERVKNMIVHPDFECGRWTSDIALLELSAPVEWSESVRPACLPPEYGRAGYTFFSGKSAITAGWGWLGEDKSLRKCKTSSRFTLQRSFPLPTWTRCTCLRFPSAFRAALLSTHNSTQKL
jgi:hypothetical protein